MKNLLTRVIVLLMVTMLSCISNTAYAQECHTPAPDTTDYKQIPWYGDESNYTVLDRMYDSLYNIYGPSAGPQYRGYEEGIILRIPLKFWIYEEAPGVAGVNNDDLPNELGLQFAVDRLNDAFRSNNLAFRFFILEVQPVENANAVDMNAGERTALSSTNKHFTALNVHVPNDGGDRYEPWNNAVFINRSRFAEANNSTLTHEIGHYFGLLHTHEFHWFPCFREPVSRGLKLAACPVPIISKRCVHTGDLLCDTEADPRMSTSGTYNGSPDCTWNANGTTDWWGDTYRPDPNNYMGYANTLDNCGTDFSSGQKKWMFVWAFNFIGTTPYKGAVQRGWLPSNNDRFDIYEPDNEAIAARTIFPGQTQEHTFHKKGEDERRHDVDWVVFTAPACGLTKPVTFTVTNRTTNAVDEVAFFERAPGGNEGPELTATENNGTFTLSSGNLVPGDEYLIRITKATDNSQYDISFPFDNNCIFGPDLVCSSNTLFSIPSRPAGSTISWTKSSNLTYVAGQGKNAYTVKANSSASGEGWVRPSITLNGQTHQLPRKNVWVGPPAPAHSSDVYVPGFYGQNPITLAGGAIYDFEIEPLAGANSYSWDLPSGFSWGSYTATGTQAEIWTPNQNGTYSLKVYASNNCGNSGGFTSLIINIGATGGCPNPPCIVPHPNIVLNPNPTSDEVHISISNLQELESEYSDNQLTYQVTITDLSGNILKRGALNKNGLSMKLKSFQPGVYLVRLTNKEFEGTYRIIIE